MASTKKRLVLELDPSEHNAIKAQASLVGVPMRQYVLDCIRMKDRRFMPDNQHSVPPVSRKIDREKVDRYCQVLRESMEKEATSTDHGDLLYDEFGLSK